MRAAGEADPGRTVGEAAASRAAGDDSESWKCSTRCVLQVHCAAHVHQGRDAIPYPDTGDGNELNRHGGLHRGSGEPHPCPDHATAPPEQVLTSHCLLSGTPWNGARTSDLMELVAIDGLASNGMPLPNCYPIPRPTPQAQTAAASTAPLLQSPPARVDPLTFLLHRVGRRNVCDAGAKRLPCEASRRRLRARAAAAGPTSGAGLD